MEIIIKGIVKDISSEIKGNGPKGSWSKKQLIISDLFNGGTELCIIIWPKNYPMIEKLERGTKIQVEAKLESKASRNDNWYTVITAKQIKPMDELGPPAPDPNDWKKELFTLENIVIKKSSERKDFLVYNGITMADQKSGISE